LRQRVDFGSICLVAKASELLSVRNLPQHIYFGNLIGSVELSPNDFFNTTMETVGSSRKLYAADLAVREDCRRKGVASRLLQEMETFAINHYFDEIYLHVEIGNSVARNLYLKHGYIEVPMNECTVAFTEARLQKPAEFYCLLWKELWSDNHSNQ
jgi:ribosomal protein S18 acetylase RimI-like enzyme